MAEQPTEAQIKEFWEWCGQERYYCGKEIDIQHFPRIDLNNLFKYAVPKAQMMGHRVVLEASPDGAFVAHIVRKESVDTVGLHFDPALALFWALWQVKEHKNDN